MRGKLAALAAACCLGCASAPGGPAAVTPADIPNLEAKVAHNATDAPSAIRLAQAYRVANRADDARQVLERVVTAKPNDPQATLLLGVAYEDLGRFGDARRLYRSYIDHAPSGKVKNELANRLPLLQRRELAAQAKAALAREAEVANTPPQPWTIAVFPYQFIGIDSQFQPLGRALAEMLVNDLSLTSRLKVLERAQVQVLLDEMKLAGSAFVDPATAARTGRLLGAERVVQGSIDGGETTIQLETSIVRVSANAWPGEAAPAANRPNVTALSEFDALQRLVAMQKRLALRIYSSLGIELTPAERERVNRRPTENVMAVLSYGRGLQAEDAGDYARAKEQFQQAAILDPRFAAAANAWQRANAQASAENTTTTELAATVKEPTQAAAPSDPDFFLPNPLSRDKVAEILRTEGTTATILELIIKKP